MLRLWLCPGAAGGNHRPARTRGTPVFSSTGKVGKVAFRYFGLNPQAPTYNHCALLLRVWVRAWGFGYPAPPRCFCRDPSTHGQTRKRHRRLSVKALECSLCSQDLCHLHAFRVKPRRGQGKIAGLDGDLCSDGSLAPAALHSSVRSSRNHPKRRKKRKAPGGGQARRADASRAGEMRQVGAGGQGRGDATPLRPQMLLEEPCSSLGEPTPLQEL